MSPVLNLRWLNWLLGSLLVAAVFAVFHQALWFDFVQWDDDLNIYDNEHIRGLNSANLRWMFGESAYARRYMPLGWLGWAINYEISGLKPFSFHLGNILFHGANTVLVFLLIRRLLAIGFAPTVTAPGVQPPQPVSQLIGAALGALVWAIHPLRVETVAWASARIYDQALFFALVSLLSYLRSVVTARTPVGRVLWYGVSVFCFAGSLLTYPIGLSLGLMPLLLDIYPLKRFSRSATGWWTPGNLRVLAEKIPYLVILGGVFTVTLWARVHSSGPFASPLTLEQFGLLPRMMQAFYIWAYYLWKPFYPTDLAPVYTTLVSFEPLAWPFLLSAVAVAGLTIIFLLKRRSWPAAMAVWVCYLLLLVPLLGLTEHPYYPSDRYSYIVAIPWSFLLAAAWSKLSARLNIRMSIALGMSMLVMIFTCGLLSFRQTRIWRDSRALFVHTLETLGPHNYRGDIHWRMGVWLNEEGKLDEAAAHLTKALEVQPTFAQAHDSLASVLAKQGKTDEALVHHEKALQISPRFFQAHINMARLFGRRGQTAKAAEHYRAALALEPGSVEGLNNFAWLLATGPDATSASAAEAVRLAEKACALTQYGLPKLIGTLAACYAAAGRFPEAVARAQQAAQMAATSGQRELAATNQQLLELYRAGGAYREPPTVNR